MLNGIWGRKIGMTQVFSAENTLVPVTVIDLDHWIITDIKTSERDGYDALQIGNMRRRYQEQMFSSDWLQKPKKYFEVLKELKIIAQPEQAFEIGQKIDYKTILSIGQTVNVFGMTKGKGFQGVIKRHGFSGGKASHGPRFGRWPGSVGFMRSQGRIIKGKKLPGHMGTVKRAVKKLEIVQIHDEGKVALIKGSVPGGAGSLVFMQKA
jgi:large subunit ribosomal protein L3